MKYEHFDELPDLIERKLISRRKHPDLPIWIHNYTPAAQFTLIAEWTPAMCDCRGLILDEDGDVVARPFRKFWNYEQVLDRIPTNEPFSVWEKLDGSLGIVCWYGDELVVATRGSFESDQARWAHNHMKDVSEIKRGLTYLFEIIYPENRIVVDYGDRRDMPLLAVLDAHGEHHPAFGEWSASKARCFDGLTELDKLSEIATPGEEGFVIRWSSGFMAKVKFLEYKRLHRLITQCSTRTIWELLRTGKDTSELLERVPADFQSWAREQINGMEERHNYLTGWARTQFVAIESAGQSRKEFAETAKIQEHPSLLFALLDGKPIDDMVWKLVEPKWSTPFRTETE